MQLHGLHLVTVTYCLLASFVYFFMLILVVLRCCYQSLLSVTRLRICSETDV